MGGRQVLGGEFEANIVSVVCGVVPNGECGEDSVVQANILNTIIINSISNKSVSTATTSLIIDKNNINSMRTHHSKFV